MPDSELKARAPDVWYFTVEAAKVREFAEAVFESHRCSDLPPVPPTYPIYGLAEMQHHFFFRVLNLERARVLNGGQEFEYRRPLRIGDRLACTGRIADEYVKEGKRGGRMRFIVLDIDMVDATNGELVGRSRSTVIERLT
jgi:hypothetical protein